MKKRNQSLTGRSFTDGIEFTMQGKYSSIIVKEGKILRRHTKREVTRELTQQIKENFVSNFLIVALIIPIFFISNIANVILYTSMAIFIGIILLGLTMNKEIKEYHAVEHMVINAFERYKRIPTIQEVKKTSSYSSMCGSNNAMFCSISLFLMGIYVKYTSREMLYIISCIMIINMILYVNNSYRFIQIFLLKKPTDKKLNLAILALEELLKQLK